MKKVSIFGVCCLVTLFAATVCAQPGGFTGPQAYSMPQGGFTGPQGSGQFAPVPVAQVSTFADKTQAILQGHIVQGLGGDRYLFRDSSGDIVIKIKHDRWWGLTVGPKDLIEIGGVLRRYRGTMQIDHFDAQFVRMAILKKSTGK